MRTALIAFLLLLVSGPLFAQTTVVDETGLVIPVQANRTNLFTGDQSIGNAGGVDVDSYKLILFGDEEGTPLYGGMYIDYSNAELRIGTPSADDGSFYSTIHLNAEYLEFQLPGVGEGLDSLAIVFKADNGGISQTTTMGVFNHVSAPYFTISAPLAAGGDAAVVDFFGDGLITRLKGDLQLEGGDFGLSTDPDLIQVADNLVTVNGVFVLGVTVWDDMRVPLTSAPPGPGNNHGFDVFQGAIRQYAFDPDTEEELFFTAQLSHGYKYGTDLEPHIHWAPKTTDTGDCRWCIEYSLAEIGGVYGAPTTICGLQAGSGVAYEHQIADLGSIDGSAIDTVSATITGRVYRDADAGGVDTFTGDAYGIELDFHYQKDTLGSASELAK